MKTRRRKRKRQKGGIFPLAAILPALIAGGKAVALGAASGAEVSVPRKHSKPQPHVEKEP